MYIFKFKNMGGLYEATKPLNSDILDSVYDSPFLTFELNSMIVNFFYHKNLPSDFLTIAELTEICNSGPLIIEDDNLKNSSYLAINHEIGILLNDDVALYLKMKYNKVNFKLEEV